MTTRDKITKQYNTTPDDAARIISYYNDTPEIIPGLAADPKRILKAAKHLNIDLQPPEKITHKTKKQITTNADIIPTIQGDIIQSNELPPDTADIITTWLHEYAAQYNIELDKAAAIQWRAACIYIGQHIKSAGLLRDHEREKHNGGIVYSPEKLEQLLYIYEFITASYKHLPLVVDFVAFAGVHRNYFYDYDGRALTSSRGQIVKKARDMEEAAMTAGLSDSNQNPTGRIYYTKARLGWRETTEIIHTSAKEAQQADVLPVFDDAGRVIEDKTTAAG